MPALKTMFKLCSVNIAMLSLLASCASDTTDSVNTEVREAITSQLPDIPAELEVNAEQIDWLSSFNDPVLEALITEALANNRNLQAAATAVDRAQALAVQASAGLTPTANLSAGADRAGAPVSGATPSDGRSLGVQLSWELDVWGRVRSGAQAAQASAEAAQADFLYSQYSLAASTIKAYLLAVEANLQQEVTNETLESLVETNRIVDLRVENGLASQFDASLARSDLASARDRLASVEGSQRDAQRALELLLGRYPAAEIDVQTELPTIPAPPPSGVSSDLLDRRPDLIAAERRVAGAFNALDQAKAARLPTIGLTAGGGGSSSALSGLLDGSNVAWQTGTSLLAPIFDGGARGAQVDIATADQRQSLAAYAQAALNAFNEVESLLDQGMVLQQRIQQLQLAADETDEAYRIADLRYREGETDILDVLTIQNRVISNTSNLVSVRRALLEQRVNLFLALGGDWNIN